MTEKRGELVLRVVPGLTQINTNGHIFGGWILSQMDIAGGIVAGRLAEGAVATVAIDAEPEQRPNFADLSHGIAVDRCNLVTLWNGFGEVSRSDERYGTVEVPRIKIVFSDQSTIVAFD